MNLYKKADTNYKRIGLQLLFFVVFTQAAYSQNVAVGTPQDQLLRDMQLLGKVQSTSFSIRPIVVSDSLRGDSNFSSFYKPIIKSKNGKSELSILPLVWMNQFNSKHPYGWNDGAMIPARGYQILVSGGIAGKLGPLRFKLQPEFVYAANEDFAGFREGKTNQELSQYITFNRSIDVPERFGDASYSKMYWGQSSVKLEFDPIAFGLSTENLWWGPGIYNSLIMSNNAPGFTHLTFNTTRPIVTPVGAIELQLIGGRLNQSGFKPLLNTTNSNGVELFTPHNPDRRYLAGINVNIEPRWLKGLTIGFTRTFMSYEKDLEKIEDYLPIFVKLQKKTGDQDRFHRDQRISMYSRWLLPKANAEVYFEYAINDNAYNFRDFFGSPDHGRAYMFGFNKLLPISLFKSDYLRLSAEVTQLSQSIDRTVREAGSFYHHGQVVRGYTNKGQVIGAGIGTGGNLQTVQLTWVKGFKSLGLQFDRYEHSVDFEQRFYRSFGANRRWVDFALGVNAQWDYKNFIFNAKLKGIQSLNYMWLMKDYVPSQNYIPNNDVFNFHGQLGLTYRF